MNILAQIEEQGFKEGDPVWELAKLEGRINQGELTLEEIPDELALIRHSLQYPV